MSAENQATAYEAAMKQLKQFEHELNERFKEFDAGLGTARIISREAVYKLVFLSASIVGFSATIQSIEGLSLNTDQRLLKLSWVFFLTVLLIGPLMNFIEARAKYTIAWRGFQAQEHDWRQMLNSKQKLQALTVLMYSVIISPRSLLLCRIYTNKTKKKLRARQNGMTVAVANLFINFVLFLEVIFIITFIAALVVLTLSVGI